jgi:hypothetical protein
VLAEVLPISDTLVSEAVFRATARHPGVKLGFFACREHSSRARLVVPEAGRAVILMTAKNTDRSLDGLPSGTKFSLRHTVLSSLKSLKNVLLSLGFFQGESGEESVKAPWARVIT